MQDKKLFYLSALLITISILLSYSLTTFTVLYFNYSHFHFFIRQLISGIISIAIIWLLATRLPLKYVNRFGIGLFIISFLLMIAMVVMPSSLVTAIGGAKRWIKLPGFSIAPVEFFKVGFVYFLAWSFTRKFQHSHHETLLKELVSTFPYLVLFFIAVLSIAVFQNDIGQVMVLGLTFSFMLLFAGRSLKLFFIFIGAAVALFVIFVSISENRIARIKMWWASAQKLILSYLPSSLAQELKVDDVQESYQLIQSLNAIHHGGFIGQGLGNGQFKLGFLSDVHTDFVLAGMTEELGFIATLAISFIYILLIHRIFKIANRTRDMTTYLFSSGMASLIGFSFLINSFGISSLIPIKGLAVPLLSYGGSALIATSIGIGLVLLLSKKSADGNGL
ncbi:MAG: FtsW/RodA/SpoVE family cell cycle protein [Epsilonproteobacteria bacterium]|nr:cell division protein [Campylobacterota bacterium]NPA56306.1 FtsW/RodA/SpoVE family cell cycle protein [Campylobacterota bacterium]